MVRCTLCFSFTGNMAEYTVTFGCRDEMLQVCRWCLQDLRLLGFKANQVIRLAYEGQPKTGIITLYGALNGILEAEAHG